MVIPKITLLSVPEKYKISLRFNDGVGGDLDLSDMAGKGLFKAWDIGDNFKKAFIDKESGAVSWPGNLDIDPLNCYLQLSGLTYEQFRTKSQQATNAIS